ncbi:MAG: CDP-alcohol phosphatidyltransferase family protein [Tannerella sp.]|jgi:CDP-diacylglycerol--serine O-phosphatidyltransferase|nr:CDP-alcohol phosphatidyltransferase family protein [Tannerella sp.]
MKIRQHIPNAITCCNLAAGFYACILALNGHCAAALLAVLLAAALDVADGLAARLLDARSAIGKDLDSLADAVSFGVAPGMALFDLIDRMQHAVAWTPAWAGKAFLAAAFAVPVLSALRLARFNHDARQETSFIGLPVPAHAVFWMALVSAVSPAAGGTGFGAGLSFHLFAVCDAGAALPAVIVATAALAVATSLLLVAPVAMFSLKMTSLRWRGNGRRYVLLAVAAVLVACLGALGIALTVVCYVLLSIFNRRNE